MADDPVLEVLDAQPLIPGKTYVLRAHKLTPRMRHRIEQAAARAGVEFIVLGPDIELISPEEP